MSSAPASVPRGTRQAMASGSSRVDSGIFHNWPTLANLQEQYRGNPPGNIFPTFYRRLRRQRRSLAWEPRTINHSVSLIRILPARPLNAKGGITGLQFNIGGIDPNLVSPVTYTYSAAVDRELLRRLVASLSYSRRHWSQTPLRRWPGLTTSAMDRTSTYSRAI